jgi:hypothetical protein
MNERVELKLRYPSGEEVHLVATRGVDGAPAKWKVFQVVKNVFTNEEHLYELDLAKKLRNEISQYFGIKF